MYFTPVLGGWVADRWIGQRNAVAIGAMMMSAGHLAMAFDASFLIALLLLIVGCGLLKGNISTQVGGLYGEQDRAGRARGFSIFSIGINLGAVAGPLLCGLLAQLYGWHAGFGLAGLLMLIGLATYLAGYRRLPASVRSRPGASAAAPLDRRQWRVVGALFAAMAITMFQSIAYLQNSNVALIWIDRSVDLQLLGHRVPTGWPTRSILSSASSRCHSCWPGGAARRAAAANPRRSPRSAPGRGSPVRRICCWRPAVRPRIACRSWCRSSTMCCCRSGVSILLADAARAGVARRATAGPRHFDGHRFPFLFLSNVTIGWIGAVFERITPLQFWALHAAIAGTGGVLALTLGRRLERMLAAP